MDRILHHIKHLRCPHRSSSASTRAHAAGAGAPSEVLYETELIAVSGKSHVQFFTHPRMSHGPHSLTASPQSREVVYWQNEFAPKAI
jgi:hypothetical protein